jgi:hypothetical protein
MRPIQWALLGSVVACVVAIGCDGRVSPGGADASAPVVDGGSTGPVLLDGIERFPPGPRLVRAACDSFTQQYSYDDSGQIIGWDYRRTPVPDKSSDT